MILSQFRGYLDSDRTTDCIFAVIKKRLDLIEEVGCASIRLISRTNLVYHYRVTGVFYWDSKACFSDWGWRRFKNLPDRPSSTAENSSEPKFCLRDFCSAFIPQQKDSARTAYNRATSYMSNCKALRQRLIAEMSKVTEVTRQCSSGCTPI